MSADLTSPEGLTEILNSIITYLLNEFIPSIFEGNLLSIAVGAIVAIFVLILFFELTLIVFSILKRFFLAIIVFVSLYFFVINFQEKIFSPEPDIFIVAIGILGILVGIVALIISLASFHKNIKGFKVTEEKAHEEEIIVDNNITSQPSILEAPKIYTLESLKKPFQEQFKTDKSLLAVLSYVIIAEFGIFSSPTVSAPNIFVGIIFLGVFLVGALLFIKTSYHNYFKGVRHLIAASIFGFALSILLGHFWAGIPLDQILSLAYFTSNSLVAFVTGIAVSLLMGTRG